MTTTHCARSWPLKHYARMIGAESGATASSHEETTSKKVWKQFSSSKNGDGSLKIKKMHTSDGQLIITVCHNSTIQERWFLEDASTRVRAITSGDSALFFVKNKGGLHQFKIQFDSHNGNSSLQQCEDFASHMSNYFPIKRNNVQSDCSVKKKQSTSEEDPSLSITKELLSTTALPHENLLPDEEIKDQILSCLRDPTFPAFVGVVENIMKSIIAENE